MRFVVFEDVERVEDGVGVDLRLGRRVELAKPHLPPTADSCSLSMSYGHYRRKCLGLKSHNTPGPAIAWGSNVSCTGMVWLMLWPERMGYGTHVQRRYATVAWVRVSCLGATAMLWLSN